jgi:hypothetical protein
MNRPGGAPNRPAAPGATYVALRRPTHGCLAASARETTVRTTYGVRRTPYAVRGFSVVRRDRPPPVVKVHRCRVNESRGRAAAPLAR